MTLKTLCEAVSKNILPAIRAVLAKILVEEYGYTQIEASKMLGVSQPAISNYLLSKRGKRGVQALMSDEKIMGIIRRMAHYLVVKDYSSLSDALDMLLSYIKKNDKLLEALIGRNYREIFGLEKE
ncbi:transcriptional regulator [Staphylothermus hellenicus]|uniref:Transcriptional regulator protein-like protein n=1 Tax=Staphylothermus hellenicus (strain DSM 12710 / JCM 10830 / BK20S6-10-b1 / P8) TaxID=591019 RepID=D7D8E2_STAHD|nr:helix-turn-helix domain-containing protein [Staphylothermus hellenicus]ADI32038.1 transcriptional regulator protein-like protein [Staphylothermus hellenicus DSM 12710]